MPRDLALEADRDVAEADRPMARVEQRARDDADRVREVDDPCIRRRARSRPGRRSRARRAPFASPWRTPGAGRLLTDAPAGERDRLVAEPRRLARRPGAGAARSRPRRRRGSRSPVTVERAGKALSLEHPRGHLPHDRRVAPDRCRGGRARDGMRLRSRERPDTSSGVYVDPPPITASFIPSLPSASRPRRTPSGRGRRRGRPGSITSSVAAIVRFHCTWWRFRNCDNPIDATQLSGFSPV